MRRIVLLMVLSAMLGGCANSPALIKSSSISTRADVFEEFTNGAQIPPGYADVRLTATFKTHLPGLYSASDTHGTPDYKLLLNVDGQVEHLQASLQSEKTGANLADPEAGAGVMYRFSKAIRLKAGEHKVVLALPGDELAIERQVTLTEGSSNSLILEPVYRQAPGKRRPGYYGVTTFKEGIKGLRLLLNEKPL